MAQSKTVLVAAFGAGSISRCRRLARVALAVVAVMPAALAAAQQYDDSRVPPWQRPPMAAGPSARFVADTTSGPASSGRASYAQTAESAPESIQAPPATTAGPRQGGQGMPVESSQDVFGDGPVQGNPEGGCAECGEGCCDPYGAANYEPFWKPFIQHVGADVEYLHWWVKGAEAPALVTTGPTTQTQAQAGVLGQPGTAVLFGGSGLNGNDRSGARVTLDYWFDKCENFALEGSWFGLGDDPSTYQASSTGTPILARPFLDVTTGNQDSRVIAYPGTFVGGVNASADLQLSGAEALVRHVLIRQGESRLDFLWGYRYLSLQDNLTITDTSTSTALNATASTIDQFLVSNEFNGFELGFKGQFRRERWSMDLLMKLGLGDMHSVVGIGGRTTTTTPTSAIPTASLGGLLAQPTNMGQYEQDQFAVVPELGMRVHYDLTPRMEASVGYTMLYVSKVVRAAEQVDPSINDTQFGGGTLTGLARPAFNLMTNDFWAQGIDVGLQYRF